MKAGFIGLGNMGGAIARRLARSGFAVTGCDMSEQVLAEFDEPGTSRTNDPLQAADGAAMLGICVRTDAQLRAVAGDGRLFAAMAPGGLVMLHSTVAPGLARELAQVAAQHGIGFVDVGVSGGPQAAEAGSLALFVGGEPHDIDRARPWLDAIGKVFALGGVGRGQEGKLLNNLVSLANYATTLAVLDVGEAMGFDRDQLAESFLAGSAQSFGMVVAPPMIRAGTDAPRRAAEIRALAELLRKDLTHGSELDVDAPAALGSLVTAGEALITRLTRAAAEQEGGPVPADPDRMADAYFAAIRARDIDALVALFASDATLKFPDGRTAEGADAVRHLYSTAFAAGWPTPTPGARIATPTTILVEVAAISGSGSEARTANLYRFDRAGLIRELSIYMQG